MKKNNINNIKDTGFKVPKDYFANLEDRLMSDIKLNQTVKNSGFKLPDNYFNTLENQVLSGVSKKEPTKVIPLFNKKNLLYVASVAAAVLLLLNLSIFEKKTNWDTLNADTVENYILNGNVGTYEIASLLLEGDIEEENFTSIEFTDEAMEGYFIENANIEDLMIK